jgi:hypothetical protein
MAFTLQEFLAENPDPMRAAIVDVITSESVFLPRLYYVTTPTMAYTYAEETLPGVGWRNINGLYPTNQDIGAIMPKTELLAIFGGMVLTDSQFANANTRISKITAKVRAASLFFDWNVIKGNPAAPTPAVAPTGAGTPVNQQSGFLGLEARLTGAQVKSCGANGGALTLDLLDQTLDAVVGSNNKKWIVCSKAQRRKISQLYRPNAGTEQRFIDNYEDAQLLTLDENGGYAPIIDFNETQGTATNASSLYVIRPGGSVDDEWFQGTTREGMISHRDVGDFGEVYKDIIEGAMGIAMFHARAAARLSGILNQ